MNKTKLILIISFLLMFAAGTALGLFIQRMQPPPSRASGLTKELKLTPEQQKQMEQIWSELRPGGSGRQQGDPRAVFAQQRDEAVLALLTEAQRTQYDAIQQDYTRKLEQLSQDRKRMVDEAVERTKKILTPEQAAKYDEWLTRQRERGGPGMGPGMRGPRHHRTAPASEPASEPAGQ